MLKSIDVPAHWRRSLWILLLLQSCFLLLFWEGWRSMASVWSGSDTFAHGFLVAPVSLWLLWSRKEVYARFYPQPSPWGLAGMMICGFGWLAAELSQVLVVEQFALAGMLICLIWSVLGNQLTRNMLFPLGFLFLMVPFGEDFVPYLMEYTASFVVAMLRLTGMSVYREGLHFTLTSGNWSVVEACSGIRYLIASITLGLLYAYLNYTSYRKRAVFILASILLPILANGVRAYMIVMIGHLSSMKLATGVDHIIYGWVFFGLVMLLLFYIGSFWRDDLVVVAVVDQQALSQLTIQNSNSRWVAVMSLLCLAVWPVAAMQLHARQAVTAVIPSEMLQNLPAETVAAPAWQWRPLFDGVVVAETRFVADDEQVIGIYFANFGDESRGGELVNSQNILVSGIQRDWRVISASIKTLDLSTKPWSIEEQVITDNRIHLLVMRWYRIGRTNTANAYYAKWLQLLKRLSGDAAPEMMVVVYTQTPHNDYRLARERLQKIALGCCE
ncbi:exosortase A [Methylomonas sp. SURF-2]|uniref:Exosortase A n=1 Tax=Methylomonas subterranea TaxID=2952225 RepID=A0ABT1TEC8_9GAMM|nr:exosortase A [Methylomonas sp. SURF-2]MCQ8103114.1 exosortase A [Methylomonas sp. SURF-2]